MTNPTLENVQERIYHTLAQFHDATLREWGSIYLELPENPVVCQIKEAIPGVFVVELLSPILIDLIPPRDLYELISIQQHQHPFGAIILGAGAENGQILMQIRAQLFADNINVEHLVRAVRMVHEQALSLISLFRRITPPLGGHTASELN